MAITMMYPVIKLKSIIILCMGETTDDKDTRLGNEITIEKVMQQLNFSRSTLEALEKGNLEFIQYPLNYFFTRQYASYLKVPFPEQFLMTHFKPRVQK